VVFGGDTAAPELESMRSWRESPAFSPTVREFMRAVLRNVGAAELARCLALGVHVQHDLKHVNIPIFIAFMYRIVSVIARPARKMFASTGRQLYHLHLASS
jgi:hypothetical protein